MKLLKTSFFSGIITLVRIISGFISVKVVAVLIGASGVALVGAFSNFVSIILTGANGAINNGIVKYASEYKDDEVQTQRLYSTTLRISIICSATVGISIILFSTFFSNIIFNEPNYKDIVRNLGCTIIFYSFNSLLISILNGRGQINLFTIINLVGTIVGLIITIVLSYYFSVKGALLALILSQTIIFFITFFSLRKEKWMSWEYFNGKVDKTIIRNLSRYSLMAVVTALTVPVSQIIVRNIITEHLGLDKAGVWQGMMRVSEGYLMIVNTALVTYFLPKLSKIDTKEELFSEIKKGYIFILPFTLISCVVIYLLRFYIINLLYNKDFLEMESLFMWQLIGDFFKVASYIIGYLLLAKAVTKVYIISEIFFSLSLIILSYLLINRYGLEGSTIAFGINYFLYMIFIFVTFYLLFYKKEKI